MLCFIPIMKVFFVFLYNLQVLPVDLADNLANAYYVYIVTIFTGVRLGAGTTSDVHVCLIGEY